MILIDDVPLTEGNFTLYCAKAYDGKFLCSTEEFDNDLKRIGYIRKLVTRYVQTGDLKERLILNHITVLYNVFGARVTPRLLFFKLEDQFQYIKPFLILLNIMPEQLYNIGDRKIINTDCIPMDQNIIAALRKI